MNKIKEFSLRITSRIKGNRDIMFLPISKLFNSLGFTPNGLTIISLLSGILAAIFLNISKDLFLLFIFLHFLFDLFDGSLARYQGLKNKKGWWIDYATDRIVTISVLFSAIFLVTEKIIPILALFFYVSGHAIYLIKKREYQLFYYALIFYILIYFNPYIAVVFFLIMAILNLVQVMIQIIFIKKGV
ncbi:MAG: CDP-alcohol phosphatidyltransferase family protein [Candidatus Nanoarchaeia archaeon]|nr:CDP-alcohol phosphatidyltransferase family protein [Candidatus Nanoarchaeia archaeon]